MKRLTYLLGVGGALVTGLILSSPSAFATITGINTGATATNVSSDSNTGATVALPASITITLGAADITGVGTLILQAPVGYSFDATSTVTPTTNVTGLTFTGTPYTPTASTITITLAGTPPLGANTNTIVIPSIKVKAAAGCPIAAPGAIIAGAGSTAAITGITMGTTALSGNLTQIPGAAAKLTVAFPGQIPPPPVACQAAPLGTPNNIYVSQTFGLGLAALDQFNNLVTGYTGNKTITFTATNNAQVAYTNAVTFTGGQSSSYVPTTVLQPSNIYVQLTASDGSISSGPSTQVLISAPSGGSTIAAVTKLAAPAAPTGLAVTATTQNGVSLSWTAVSGVAGYDVYISTTGTSGSFSLDTPYIPSVTGTTYNDTNLMTGVKYYYAVAAVNSQNTESTLSTAVPATPAAVAAVAAPAATTAAATPAATTTATTVTTPSTPAYTTTTTTVTAAAPAATGLPYVTPVGATQIQANITYLQQQLVVLLQQLLTLLQAGH